MDITHPGQQLIFYFDVIVELFLYIFHCLLHILNLLLFVAIICVIGSDFIYLCLTNMILVLFIFVDSFCVCVYLHMYAYLCIFYIFIYF